MSNILVTGGEGLVGSHLVHTLADLGHKVTSVDNHFNSSDNPRHPAVDYWIQDCKFIRQSNMAEKEFDYIFHLGEYARVEQSFEDLDIWKRACRLATEVYKNLKNCRDYGLKDQMTRAAVSIASNIAEGAERNSEKEYRQFLHIAKGSAAELRTQLYIAGRIGIIDKAVMVDMAEETKAISAKTQALVNKINSRTA